MVWGRSFCSAEYRDFTSALSKKAKSRFFRDLVTFSRRAEAVCWPKAFSSTVLAYSKPPSVTALLVRQLW